MDLSHAPVLRTNMTECEICNIIEGKEKRFILYEDQKAMAVLDESAAAKGQIMLFPKQHYTIFEQVPDYLLAHLSKVVNRLSIGVFEGLSAQGTNIFIANGISAGQKYSHFVIYIVPRWDNDKIKLEWKPKQMNEEELSTIEIQMKEQTSKIGNFEQEPQEKQVIIKKEPEEEIKEEKEEQGENYMLKHLRRLP